MQRGRVRGGVLAVAVFVLACGGDDPQPSGAPLARDRGEPVPERAENEAPVVERIVLHPPRPLAGQRIEARIEASDPDGDPIRLELEWRHDGRVISRGPNAVMTLEQLAKGDEVEVVVTATDGRDTSAPAHASVTAGNREPLIEALYLAPDGEIAPGQAVTAAPRALDPDGDPLEYEFVWVLNGQVVRGAEEAAFATDRLKRGDRLQARVRVSDGEAFSPIAESMTLELANSAPRFKGLPEIAATEGAFHADLEAQDPDGDHSLRFRLIEGPPGLTVDAVSGRVSWRPGADAAGTHAVEVAVGDSFGAESAMRFELTVAGAGAAAPPAKADASDDGEESDESEAGEEADATEKEESEESEESEETGESEA